VKAAVKMGQRLLSVTVYHRTKFRMQCTQLR